jgi:TP901 family phage tail tape measure protein
MGVIVGQLTVEVDGDATNLSSSLKNVYSDGNKFTGMLNGNLSSLTSSFGSLGSGITMAFQAAGNVINNVGESIKSVGSNLTQYITVPLAAAGTAVFTFGKNFESEMSKVVGLVGVSKDQVDEWGTTILDLAPTIGQTPQNLAEGLFYVTSAGLRGAEAMEVLEMSGKAASSGLGETATIADLVTSAMNAYGSENLSASQATDILTAAVREGKAKASELASSMGQVLPLASEMGVSFDQVAASQAAMTKTGTSASEASTQLKSILSGLLKPSQQAEEALEGMGTSSSELRKSIKEKGLMATLGDLRTLTNKYGEDAMAKVFPNIRALSGVLDLMGSNAEDNVEVFDNVANSTGSLEDAFQAASETADFKWNQALSQLQSTAIGFFDTLKVVAVPVMEKITEVLAWVSDAFANLSPQIQQASLVFGLLLAAVGPVLTVIGTLITAIVPILTGLLTTWVAVTGVIMLFGTALIPIIALITAIIGVIAGLVAGLIHLWNTNEGFRENVISTWEYIKTKAVEIFNNIKEIITIVLNKIKEFWSKHGDTIMKVVSNFWNFILLAIKGTINIISNLISLTLNVIKGNWSGAWQNIKNILSTVWAGIKTIIRNAVSVAIELMKKLVSKVVSEFKKIPGKIKAVGSAIKAAAKYGINLAYNYITGRMEMFKKAGAKIGSMVASGIKSAISKCTSAASDMVSAIRDFLPFSPAKVGPLSDLDKLNFGSSIAKSLQKANVQVQPSITNLADSIGSALVSDLNNTSLDVNGTSSAKTLNIQNIDMGTIQDATEFLKELKQQVIKRTGSRFL